MAVGSDVVVVGDTAELAENAELLEAAGARVRHLPAEAVTRIEGRGRVERVAGERLKTPCDAVVFALGLVPRDSLLRQGHGLPVSGAGEVVVPGCSLAEAEAGGRDAGAGQGQGVAEVALPASPRDGYVCLCEDVTVDELTLACHEGFRSSELLKRYTTVTMGPCQGILCQQHVRSFLVANGNGAGEAARTTTARPPGGALTLQDAAAGLHDEHMMWTRLHSRHLSAGAVMEPTGGWLRPSHYGDVEAEYRAVRERVSIMDVGTLGKFLVAGRDSTEFLERLYPTRIADIPAGRLRYALLLAPTGFVIDDGTICSLGGGGYYLTFTSVGAAAAESILRDWADAWQLDVHIVNLTVARGAINVAGPAARELLAPLASEPLSNDALPYLHHRELDVAGVPCRVVRLGFVGELSYELHHPSRSSVSLWDALVEAGKSLDLVPHGLDALRLLRLEKGHVMIGQDTDYDTTPQKLGMDWAVKLDKPLFVGKAGLLRAAAHPMVRRLVPIAFEGERAPAEGSALTVGGRYVGHLSSSRFSPVLGHGSRSAGPTVTTTSSRSRSRLTASAGRSPTMRSTTRRECVFVLELAPVDAALIHCLANEQALRLLTIAPPSFLGAVAPGETLLVAPAGEAASALATAEHALAGDPDALVIDLTDAYEGVRLGGDQRAAFARLADWPLPEPGALLAQGLVAQLAAKVIATGDHLFIFVGSNVGHHLVQRLREACADLDLRESAAVEFRMPGAAAERPVSTLTGARSRAAAAAVEGPPGHGPSSNEGANVASTGFRSRRRPAAVGRAGLPVRAARPTGVGA